MKKLQLLFIPVLALFLFSDCSKENAAAAPGAAGAGGSTARFTIAGNYLYVVNSTSLKAFDISNPAVSPVLKSTTDIGLNIETIFPYGDKLFIGSSNAMHVFSISDPVKPTRLAQANYVIRMACDPVVAKDSMAYATLNASGACGGGFSALVVYDISNITNPVMKNQLPVNGPYGLGIRDSALYVCDGQFGLLTYNIRNPWTPVQVKKITGEKFFDVIPYGDILIAQVAGGIVLYDITQRLNPVFLSRISN